jgi:hypothetical protein
MAGFPANVSSDDTGSAQTEIEWIQHAVTFCLATHVMQIREEPIMTMRTTNRRRGVSTPRQSGFAMQTPEEMAPSDSDRNETARGGWLAGASVVSVLRTVVRYITIF